MGHMDTTYGTRTANPGSEPVTHVQPADTGAAAYKQQAAVGSTGMGSGNNTAAPGGVNHGMVNSQAATGQHGMRGEYEIHRHKDDLDERGEYKSY
jgi:hypothetical protein